MFYEKAGIIPFVVKGKHTRDIASGQQIKKNYGESMLTKFHLILLISKFV